MHDRSSTLQDFLTATAAKQPTPGGGSVTALAGALAAALGGMVLSYSIGRKDLAPFTPELTAAADELQAARESLLDLMVQDQSVYEALTAARKRPADDPDRAEAVSDAATRCVQVPAAIGLAALSVLTVADRLIGKINPWLASDLAVTADLAVAAVRCSRHNVLANLSSLGSDHDRIKHRDDADRNLEQAIQLVKSLTARSTHG